MFQKSKSVYRIPRRVVRFEKSARANRSPQSVFSLLLLGVSTMNTKLALSAIVAALMLTACAKQESAAPEAAPAEPPAAEAPAAAPDATATPPADAAAPAGDAAAAPPADGAAAPPAEEAPKQ
jgi:hypothetical protein